ncbi:DUF4129 domain-containing protein [Desertivibrio insolitus]|uniref:DUF4129 domain-containing protein n=1 Tax=Herbiconiux sp. SYSU D00978 TaxID=2812562 RepID=UPI001A95CE07|nr:DUF4129 domain-containing protein [Herbiconiux sp. SYSU D00978]
MILPAEVPVDPGTPEDARDRLLEELSKPEYQAARPTWFDLVAEAVQDWLAGLQFGELEGPPALALLLIGLAVAAALVVAFVVFGLPRLNRRSVASFELFGARDGRSADELREAAEAAAARGDFAAAIPEMYRAIARGLAERTIVTPSPGSTAHDFARRAAEAFPDHGWRLEAAATTFDGVRYLGRVGSAAEYASVAELERDIRSATPRLAVAA